jgi:hypothetical protein
MIAARASGALLIKLGERGKLDAECVSDGALRFGYPLPSNGCKSTTSTANDSGGAATGVSLNRPSLPVDAWLEAAQRRHKSRVC